MFTTEETEMARKEDRRAGWEPGLFVLEQLLRSEARKIWFVCVDCGTRFKARGSGCSCPFCGMVHTVKAEGDEDSECKTTAELLQARYSDSGNNGKAA